MLPPKNRLNLSRIPKREFKGKQVSNEEFFLIGKKADNFKAGISISKKVAKRAVDRNRIKRLISEGLRNQRVPPRQVLVIVRKNISDLKMSDVKIKLENLLKKL